VRVHDATEATGRSKCVCSTWTVRVLEELSAEQGIDRVSWHAAGDQRRRSRVRVRRATNSPLENHDSTDLEAGASAPGAGAACQRPNLACGVVTPYALVSD
jgi:hypothetical protein